MYLAEQRPQPASEDAQGASSGGRLTPQELAIRNRMPLELAIDRSEIGREDRIDDYSMPRSYPGEQARAVLRGLDWAGLVRDEGDFVAIPGEIRRLDLLLWDLAALKDYGFQFRQEYVYAGEAHRVVARNRLKAPKPYLDRFRGLRVCPIPPPDFLESLAVFVAHASELQAGYFFLPFALASQGRWVAIELERQGIRTQALAVPDGPDGLLLRTYALEDGRKLLELLRERLALMPGALERFEQETPLVTVSKELVFDAAHFITDHPARCSNLHGGRYVLHVQVTGMIDPASGCVVDYGYLKRVAARQVVDLFDHHTLNYSAPELAWRSSTELVSVFIWERLIDYLPGLSGLTLYETPQSWCSFRGPTLEEHQRRGPEPVLRWFQGDLETSPWRNLLA